METRQKPEAPPGCPLFPHPRGYWAKTINYKTYYFGKWEDLDGALEKYYRERSELQKPGSPQGPAQEVTLAYLGNEWLEFHHARVREEKLKARTFVEYRTGVKLLLDSLGRGKVVSAITPVDFNPLRKTIDETYGYHGRVKFMKIIRMIFAWGFNNRHITVPVIFGDYFSLPSKKELRRSRREHQEENGMRMFTAKEILAQLDAASEKMKAMILLGINCGYGNTDCGTLKIEEINFGTRIINRSRAKTEMDRVSPLWPETIKAIRAIIKDRSEGLVFLTRCNQSWVREQVEVEGDEDQIVGAKSTDAISDMYGKLLKKMGQKRPGLNFYALRHTFRTIADEVGDDRAVRLIMGHELGHVEQSYIEGSPVAMDRLRKVTGRVHRWLYKR
jgi:integrase